jgi:N-acetylglucosamine kinase-like BadF-type ATPase
VDRAAGNGDAVARDILLAAGQQLAALAGAVRRQLWREGEAAALAYIGGVFRSALLRERFRMLVEMEEGTRCGPPVYGPAAGALLEAYRAAGMRPALTDVPELKS